MALKNEWLREIIGDSFTEAMDTAVASYLGKNFVSKTDFNTKNEEAKQLQKTLETRDDQLKALQALKPEEMQAQITKLQGENAAAAAQYQKDLESVKLDLSVEAALAKAGAVNVRAVKSLIDHTKLGLNKDGSVFGLEEQVTNLQKSEKWAFSAPQPTRTHQPGNKTPGERSAEDGNSSNMMNSFIRGRTNISGGDE